MAPEERHPARADYEDDECLGGERLHEPAGLKEAVGSLEHPEHDAERQEVKNGADRPKKEHEAPDERHVPMSRALKQLSSTRSVGMVISLTS